MFLAIIVQCLVTGLDIIKNYNFKEEPNVRKPIYVVFKKILIYQHAQFFFAFIHLLFVLINL